MSENYVTCQILMRQGKATAVRHRDKDGNWQGRVVPSEAVDEIGVGQAIVSRDAIDSGTEYGIDWEVVFPKSLVITPQQISNAFKDHGIWTFEDLDANHTEAIAAILSLTRGTFANLLKKAKSKIIGGNT